VDLRDVADALERVYFDRRRAAEIGRKARDYVSSELSPERVGRRY
jgi:hypothetical protein